MLHNMLKIANSLLMVVAAMSVIAFQNGRFLPFGVGQGYHSNSSTIAGVISQQAGAADTHVIVSLPAGPYTVGQAISIPITITTIPNTRSAQLGMSFNPAVLRCDSISEGTFYSTWVAGHNGSTIVFPTPRCNNTNGTISVGSVILLTNDPGGPNGTGVIFNFNFTILANGTSPLNLSSVIVSNDNTNNLQALPVTLDNAVLQVGPLASTQTSTATATGTATVTPTVTSTGASPKTSTPTLTPTLTAPLTAGCENADVNQDGAVNVMDLTSIGMHLGETGGPGWIRADVTRDGIVNTLDLVGVGMCWGQSVSPPSLNTATATATRTAPPPPAVTPTQTETATITLTPNPGATSTVTPTGTTTQTGTVTLTPTITVTGSGSTSTTTATLSTDAQVSIDPALKTAVVGQQFELSILITTTKPSRGVQIAISFDPAVLKCDSMTAGDFYSTWATNNGADSQLIPGPVINNTTGKISPTSIIVLGGDGGATGSGKLFTLKFTPKAAGTSTVELTNILISDDNITRAKALSVTSANGTVSVSADTGGSATATRTATVAPTRTATTTQAVVRTATRTPTTASGGGLGQLKTLTPVGYVAKPTVQTGAHIGFDPAVKLVATVGESFKIDLVIKNADKPVRGLSANVSFTPGIIECSAVDEGTFLSTWAGNNGGSAMLFPAPKIDNTAGTIKDGTDIMIGAQTGPDSAAGGATGSGTFLSLTCKSKAVGVANLTISNVLIAGDLLASQTYANSLGAVIETGQVFVGVTPTATAPGGSGSSGSTGSSSTQSSGGGALSTGGATQTPGGPTATPGGPTATPGIAGISNAVEIPVQAGPGNQAIGGLENFINTKAILQKDVLLRSQDGLFAVFLPGGAQALTADNYPLKSIIIDRLDKVPDGLDTKDLISSLYDISPNGATFDPNAKLIAAIDKATLPKGVSIDQLTIANYDPKNKKWIFLNTTLDKSGSSLSAPITHFSIYALKTRPFNWLWVALAAGLFLLLLALAVVLLLLRRRKAAAVVASGPILLLSHPLDITEMPDDSSEIMTPITGIEGDIPTVENAGSSEPGDQNSIEGEK
jgi:hypothetical protein